MAFIFHPQAKIKPIIINLVNTLDVNILAQHYLGDEN
jgi:hypothetical protein